MTLKTWHEHPLSFTQNTLLVNTMNKNKGWKHKKIIQNLGYTACFSCAATFWVTFMMAYFNNYHVHVTVNDYGEAHIEFILLLFMIPLSLIGFWFMLHDLWCNKKKQRST